MDVLDWSVMQPHFGSAVGIHLLQSSVSVPQTRLTDFKHSAHD